MGSSQSQSRFLNVDLEIEGDESLEPLVAVLSSSLFELRVERRRGRVLAAYETPGTSDDLGATLRALARAVKRLDPRARRVWSRARRRDFDVGIQAGTRPWCFRLPVAAKDLALILQIGGRLVLTVYAVPEARRARRRPRSST